MTPVTHILVPVDFSDASRRALGSALRAAAGFGAELTLLHVASLPPAGPFGFAPAPAPEDEASRKAEIESELAALIPDSAGRLPYRVQVVPGDVEQEILAGVDRLGADLLVMGSHGRRAFARWFLGSVTERVLRKVPIPIMTVAHVQGTAGTGPVEALNIRRILCPTDLSDSREIALPVAIDFARRYQARLDVVHVTERIERSPTSPPYTDPELAAERQAAARAAAARLDAAVAREDTGGIVVRTTVVEGRPAQAILEHAASSGADLIVMRLHGMTFIERALLGATAERVVRAAPVPVLSIPGPPAGPAPVPGEAP